MAQLQSSYLTTGLPADHDGGQGYGMKLIHMMVSQIGGTLRIESSEWTRVTLIAPGPGSKRARDEYIPSTKR